MAEAKIEIKVGSVSFSGEGESAWLSEQLDKILGKVADLANVAPPELPGEPETIARPAKAASGNLANFLRSKNAATNQVKKFLATAVWLIDTQKKNRLNTADITKALSDA